jgi:hypothetical protein
VRLELPIANDSNVLKTECLFCKYYPKHTEFGFSAHFKFSRCVLHRRCVLRIFPGCFAQFPRVFPAGVVLYAFSRRVLRRRSVLRIFPACFAISTGVFRTVDGRELRLVLGCYQSTGSVQNRGVQTPGPDAFHGWGRVGRSSVQVCSKVFTGVDYDRLIGVIDDQSRCKTLLDPALKTWGVMRVDQASYTPGKDTMSRGFFGTR